MSEYTSESGTYSENASEGVEEIAEAVPATTSVGLDEDAEQGSESDGVEDEPGSVL